MLIGLPLLLLHPVAVFCTTLDPRSTMELFGPQIIFGVFSVTLVDFIALSWPSPLPRAPCQHPLLWIIWRQVITGLRPLLCQPINPIRT